MRAKHYVLVSLASALLVLGVACGDDDDVAKTPTPASPSSSATTASPAATTPATAAATPSPTTPATPQCTTKQLQLTLQPAGGAAGTHFQSIVATNTSAAPCVVAGFPGISLVDAAGQQLGQPAERNTAIAPQAITLQPHASAHADSGFPNHELFEGPVCSGPSVSLRVFPPDQLDSVDLPLTDWACPGFSVQAFQAGAAQG
jgi:hypothetical protein